MDTQDKIDQLRRQQMTLEMLSCVLRNQLDGEPMAKEKKLQKKLLVQSASECGHIEEKIASLVRQRDSRG